MPRPDGSLRRGEAEQIANAPEIVVEPASVVGPIALDVPAPAPATDDGDLAGLTPPPNPTLADGPNGDVA